MRDPEIERIEVLALFPVGDRGIEPLPLASLQGDEVAGNVADGSLTITMQHAEPDDRSRERTDYPHQTGASTSRIVPYPLSAAFGVNGDVAPTDRLGETIVVHRNIGSPIVKPDLDPELVGLLYSCIGRPNDEPVQLARGR